MDLEIKNDIYKIDENIFIFEKKLEEIKNEEQKLLENNRKEKIIFLYNIYKYFIEYKLKDLNIHTKYFQLYFEKNYFIIEEIFFVESINNYLQFKHKSEHRKNINVWFETNLNQENFHGYSIVIDEEILENLKNSTKNIENFQIINRK